LLFAEREEVASSEPGQANGVATLSYTINLSPLGPPSHDYTIDAIYTSDSASFASGSASGTLTVTKEDATVGYTGDIFVSTAGTTGTINLKAQVLQAADGFLGNLANAAVTFKLFSSSNFTTTPDYTYNAAVDAGGVASATSAALPLDNYTLIVSFNDAVSWFDGPDSDPVVVTIYQPTPGQFVTGGGFIHDPGVLSKPVAISSTNDHGNFGFTVKYSKKGGVQGQSVFVFRGADGYNYQVKSTSWQGGGLSFIGTTGASFGGKCRVAVTNPATGLSVGGFGNGTYRVEVTDNGEPGKSDKYAVTIIDPNGFLYHQAGPGTPATQLTIGGGNIVVHSK
jgi:hypothetical protein